MNIRTSMRVRRHALGTLVLGIALLAVSSDHARAQSVPDTLSLSSAVYNSGAGFAIVLTNNGFGLGGYYQRALSTSMSFLTEASIGAGKDEREVKFFGYFGRSYIPNKANYLLMMPIQIGVQQRLFEETIEENFRPYVQLTGGPTLGWEYPYFRDCDGDGRYDPRVECAGGGTERTYDSFAAIGRGSFRLGAGGTFSVGAHFGMSRKMTQGVRIGYSFTYFLKEIQLLEPDVPGGSQRFFGTPVIILTFGRLFGN
jgi:hypothetical protein